MKPPRAIQEWSGLRSVVSTLEDRGFIMTAADGWRGAEARPDPELEEGWMDTRAHLVELARRVAARAGLALTRDGYEVSAGGELVLEVQHERGRRGSTVPEVAARNELRATKGRWSMWLPWEALLPGAYAYSTGANRTELAWGVRDRPGVRSILRLTRRRALGRCPPPGGRRGRGRVPAPGPPARRLSWDAS